MFSKKKKKLLFVLDKRKEIDKTTFFFNLKIQVLTIFCISKTCPGQGNSSKLHHINM